MAGVNSHLSNEKTNEKFQNFVTQFSSICEGTGLCVQFVYINQRVSM